MIGLGWGEVLVIAITIIIFIKPQDLPATMRQIGRAVGGIRRMSEEFHRELNRMALEIEKEADLDLKSRPEKERPDDE